MRVLSVVGARPQFVKLAPLAEAATRSGIDHVVVHTGQHYDHNMSQGFFDELGIAAPDVNLGIGSGSHGVQTGGMMAALDPIFEEYRPDWVLVYGDTNSTLAAAVCASKLQIPLAHLEAGLRSFNRRMPEEHNRVLTDHAADLCLAPTRQAMRHLLREGLAKRSHLVGDVMVDVLMTVRDRLTTTPVALPVLMDESTVLVTIHRPANTDFGDRLARICERLSELNRSVVIAAHPRLTAALDKHHIEPARYGLTVVEPLSYPQLVQALCTVGNVVTDSGGLQKEAYVMGVPTVTLRAETEWSETLENGWNVLCDDPDGLDTSLRRGPPPRRRYPHFGDGTAANRTIGILMSKLSG